MSRPWRLAKACETLRNQLDTLYPKRDRESDGGIGNAEHASRKSDHNPWIVDGKYGVVSAFDVDREIDSATKFFSRTLADALRSSHDERIKYLISDGQICSGAAGPDAWKWRPYTGVNAHKHHMHLSVRAEKRYYDSVAPWSFGKGFHPLTPELVSLPPDTMRRGVLRLGSAGSDVHFLQVRLGVKADAEFGPQTDRALRFYQTHNELKPDGIVGPATWAKLESTL